MADITELAKIRDERESERVEYFSMDGKWWLPDSPDHSASGTVTFDADGLAFVSYGSLEPEDRVAVARPFPDLETIPTIHGRTREGRRVTLVEARGTKVVIGTAPRNSYRVRMVLLDIHTTIDSYVEAWCEFDCLHGWANPPPIDEPSEDLIQRAIRVRDHDLAEANVDDVRIRLVASPEWETDGIEFRSRQRVYFVINLVATPGEQLLERWIRPVHDLLILALGRPVRLTRLFLRPADADPHQTLGEASFEAVQTASARAPRWADLEVNTAPTLLMLNSSPLPFEQLLPRWFELRSRLAEVIVLLHGPFRTDFMFSEHRFAAIFQSAEALAHACGLSGREKTRQEHAARLTDIVAASKGAGVEDEVIEWATRILRSRNDKPLSQQIQDLVLSTGEIGQQILDASPGFSHIVTSARTGVSHGGASKGLDPVGRHWHGDALRWVVRARILIELGLGLEYVEHRVAGRAGFRFAVDQIRQFASP